MISVMSFTMTRQDKTGYMVYFIFKTTYGDVAPFTFMLNVPI